MGKAVVEFLVGAAVIVTPQHQVPLLIGSAALKLGSSLVHRSSSGGECAGQTAHDRGVDRILSPFAYYKADENAV